MTLPTIVLKPWGQIEVESMIEKARRCMLLSECIRRKGTNAQIEDLIARGADLNVIDKYGQTPLMSAISGKRSEIAARLIELGADVTIRDKEGSTALQWASDHNLLDVAEMIARTRPEVLSFTDVHGNQPLWTAVMNAKGNYALVHTFIELGADPNHRNNAGRSSMDMAEMRGNDELIELFSMRR